MALKAINADCCVIVTGTTEMFRVGNGDGPTIHTHDRMAANTVLKAERLTSQAFKRGFITLVFEQIHAVTAHKIDIGHAGLALAHGYDRLGYTAGRSPVVGGKCRVKRV